MTPTKGLLIRIYSSPSGYRGRLPRQTLEFEMVHRASYAQDDKAKWFVIADWLFNLLIRTPFAVIAFAMELLLRNSSFVCTTKPVMPLGKCYGDGNNVVVGSVDRESSLGDSGKPMVRIRSNYIGTAKLPCPSSAARNATRTF
jgi:hypothetical protein